MSYNDEQTIRALAAVAKLGGFSVKKVTTGDDLKTKSIGFAIERPSDGHHQEVLDFEREDIKYSVNGRGEVMDLDPSDLTEKDETLAQATDPDEAVAESAGAIDTSDAAIVESPQLSEPEEAVAATGSKKRS